MADEEEGKPAKKGGAMKLIVMVLAALVLVGVGVGGSLYFTGMLGGGKAEEEEVQEEKEVKSLPIYFAFPKAFTVNFETASGLRFLQVRMELMSYQQEAIDAVQAHLPLIKNNIILMLSNQSYDNMITSEGKEAIRAAALKEIQSTLEKYQVEAKVEEVYFTNFVMQ